MNMTERFAKIQWQKVGLGILFTAVLAMLLLFRLGSLVRGLSSAELHQQQFSSSWHNIAANPLDLPLTFVQWVLLTVSSHHGHTVTRLASPVFGVLALVAFYYVVRRWYGQRASFFGVILFGSSSWFLHASRLATPEILYLWAIPTLIAALIYWDRHRQNVRSAYPLVLLLALLLYVPGMIWFALVALSLQPHHIADTWRQLRLWWQKVLVALVFVLALVPLGWALISKHGLFRTWLGLPQNFDTVVHTSHRLGQSVSFMFFRGPLHPELWLDRLPVFDIFTMAMTVLGILFYARHILATRSRLIIGLFIVAAVLFSLGGPVGYSALVVLWYSLAVGGIGYLLHEWFRVFPRNPLAHSVAYVLLGFVVVLACSYNIESYFVAWPHNQTTIVTFKRGQ